MEVFQIEENDILKFGFANLVNQLEDYWINEFIGNSLSPPRAISKTKNFKFVFTCGEILSPTMNIFGFRFYYDNNLLNRDDDLFYIKNLISNEEFLVKSKFVRIWRIAAISKIALRLINKNYTNLCLIGCGKIGSFLTTELVNDYSFDNIYLVSKSEESKIKLKNSLQKKTKSNIIIDCDTDQAIRSSQLIVCSSSSKLPVIKSLDLSTNWTILHIGPKYFGNHDIEAEIYSDADVIITDSIKQLKTLEEDLIFKVDKKVIDFSNLFKQVELLKNCKKIIFSSIGMSSTDILICNLILMNLKKDY